MTKIDDLNTLKRLLREFNFPISPVLEYAINEKEKELLDANSMEDVDKNSSIRCNYNNDYLSNNREFYPNSLHSSCKTDIMQFRTNTKKAALRVYRDDNSVICCDKVLMTFAQVIKEIGPQRVHNLNISSDKMNLVNKEGNPLYPSAQVYVGDGYYVNTHSGTVWKKQTLEKIFYSLGIPWRVEII